jgi:hypothetical protein
MLADHWKAAHPGAVRKFREQERRDKAERKKFRRAKRRVAKAQRQQGTIDTNQARANQ